MASDYKKFHVFPECFKSATFFDEDNKKSSDSSSNFLAKYVRFLAKYVRFLGVSNEVAYPM